MCAKKSGFMVMLLCLSLIFCSCQKKGGSDFSKQITPSTEKGSWDNSIKVLKPTAPGTHTHSCDVATVDYTNAQEGYIVVDYSGTNKKVKLQITGSDGVTYTYDLHGKPEVFPLTSGSGNYNVGVYENISGTKYSPVLSVDINATITNEFGPYLYPNQYVDFNSQSLPVAKCKELSYYCNTDIEIVQSVYNYIIANFSYDYDKAESLASGYLPVVDEIYTSNKGICFDYAAVMATMLRSQAIPTRLEVGYVDEDYHAWIITYIKNVGWVNGIIEFDGKSWKLMDPTYASTSESPQDFLTEDKKYITKYVY